MDFKAARSKAKRLLTEPTRVADLSKSSLKPDALRDNIIRDTERHTPRFQAHLKNQPEIEYEVTDEDAGTSESKTFKWTTYDECVRDAARALFDIEQPNVLPADKVRPDYSLNRDIMQMLTVEEGFQQAWPYTRMNEAQAVFSAMAMADDLQESAQTILSEHIARSEEARQAADDAASADEMFEQLRQRAKQDIKDDGAVQDPTRRGIKQAMKAQQAAQQALGQIMQAQAQSGQLIAAAQAVKSAAKAIAEAAEIAGALPGVDPGEAANLPAEKQLELAQRWAQNKTLAKIARNVGRMYRDMRFKRDARTKNVPIEPVGITTGRDLARLLPHELARGFMESLRPLFVKDWSERKLLEYEMQGKVPSGKGPIIAVVDGSGSMWEERWVWAMSVILALLQFAQREKRHFAGIQFGSSHEMRSWEFPANEPMDFDKLLDMAGHFFNGGTSTVTGMTEAARIIDEQPEFKTADVVLIGDGQDHFREKDVALRAQFTRMGVRVQGISIEARNNAYMGQMCDHTVDVEDLALDGANDATDALAEYMT